MHSSHLTVRTAYTTCTHPRLGPFTCTERCAAHAALQRRQAAAHRARRRPTDGTCLGWKATTSCDWTSSRDTKRDRGCEVQIAPNLPSGSPQNGGAGYCACGVAGGMATINENELPQTAHSTCEAGEPLAWDSKEKTDQSFRCAEQCAELKAQQMKEHAVEAEATGAPLTAVRTKQRDAIFFGGEGTYTIRYRTYPRVYGYGAM